MIQIENKCYSECLGSEVEIAMNEDEANGWKNESEVEGVAEIKQGGSEDE